MRKIYFKQILRDLQNQKVFSFIKIGGLALGIASCLLILLYILDETSYDKYYPEHENIYRFVTAFDFEDISGKGTHMPAPLARTLVQDYPEIEMAGRINASELFGAGDIEFRPSDKKMNYFEEGMVYADQELLDILHIPFVYGERSEALKTPGSIVISKEKANKYFPGENPVGKTVIIDNYEESPLTIGGVMEDFPSNSHLQYDFLVSLKDMSFWNGEQNQWLANNYFTYVKVKPGTNIEQLNKKLQLITKYYYRPAMIEAKYAGTDDFLKNVKHELQPVADIHLKSTEVKDRTIYGDIRIVKSFGYIAVFILLLACINFINLYTAKSSNRAKEVGLRKTIGSQRKNLINQFLSESFLYSLLSFITGIILACLLLPLFNNISGKNLSLPFQTWWFIPSLFLASVLVGVISGIYPSLFLSSFKPISVIKGSISKGMKNSLLRNILVVFQFTASIILIIGTFTVNNQMKYILNKDLGYTKDQVLIIQGTGSISNPELFKDELLKLPNSKFVTISDYLPVSGSKRNGNMFWKKGREEIDQGEGFEIWEVDKDYIKTLGINIIEGRDFSEKISSDKQGIILSETSKNRLGLIDPIGKQISNGWKTWTVIGVIDDIQFENFKMKSRGVGLEWSISPGMISVKTDTKDINAFISSVKDLWEEFAPNQQFRYSFLDDKFAGMHADVKKVALIFTCFAGLAIIIACLGLFGLILYASAQRRKEIGVRKVNGARIFDIVALLNTDMIKSVISAFAIASIIGWFIMNKWLETYAYRVQMTWISFALAGLFAFCIAFFTISWQSWKAAKSNPVESLRYE